MARRSYPGWRDEAASALVLRHRSALTLGENVLVAKDPRPDLVRELARGMESGPVAWNRRALGGRPASPWPPPGPYHSVLLRLPRARAELEMDLNAAASVLEAGGALFLYGANDEGIASAAGAMEELFSGVTTVATGGRCRLLEGVRRPELTGLRDSLEDWGTRTHLDHGELPERWLSFPGVFAHGRLDAGTRLLLDALPPQSSGDRVLDYGCGSGPVGAVVRKREPGVDLHLLDVDALALEAARENVPGSVFHLRDGLPPPEAGLFDAVLTNPPFHRGKAEEPAMVRDLIRSSPAILNPGGRLVLVAQRRLRVNAILEEKFRHVTVRAQDGTFHVLEGRGPISQGVFP